MCVLRIFSFIVKFYSIHIHIFTILFIRNRCTYSFREISDLYYFYWYHVIAKSVEITWLFVCVTEQHYFFKMFFTHVISTIFGMTYPLYKKDTTRLTSWKFRILCTWTLILTTNFCVYFCVYLNLCISEFRYTESWIFNWLI